MDEDIQLNFTLINSLWRLEWERQKKKIIMAVKQLIAVFCNSLARTTTPNMDDRGLWIMKQRR